DAEERAFHLDRDVGVDAERGEDGRLSALDVAEAHAAAAFPLELRLVVGPYEQVRVGARLALDRRRAGEREVDAAVLASLDVVARAELEVLVRPGAVHARIAVGVVDLADLARGC